jgi:uncharacterized protein (TIGR03086 family)
VTSRLLTCDQDYRPELADALAAFDARVRDAHARGGWTAPSPCEGWTAADVVTHVAGSVTMFAIAMGSDAPPADGGDPVQRWDQARSIAEKIIDGIEDPAATVPMKLGSREMTAGFVVEALLRDVVIHAWDLARATGGDEILPPHLVTAATAALASVPEHIRRKGLYADALDVPEGSGGQARLLALAGRRP